MPDISSIWPEWKAVKKVGEGSFGKVYKCIRSEYDIQTECAVKIISIPGSESEINAIRAECSSEDSVKAHFKEIVDEFANEIKMMVLLKGAPNIVSVENYKIVERNDTIGWDIYIQMEFLTTFTEFAKKNSFTERAISKLAMDLCSALEVCEEKNIIHRDIKPDNIFVDNYGKYKIGDFGVARKLECATSAMSKKGTYTYMAPEVYNGKAYDKRADIYSLGMVMYKLLNRGRDPFTDPYAEAVSYKQREAALVSRMSGGILPAPVNASARMARIIVKACSFDPKDRYSTPGEFKAAIRAYAENASDAVNVPVETRAGLSASKENLSNRTNKALPLFMDDFEHDEAKVLTTASRTSPISPVPKMPGIATSASKAPVVSRTISQAPNSVQTNSKGPDIATPVLKTPGVGQTVAQASVKPVQKAPVGAAVVPARPQMPVAVVNQPANKPVVQPVPVANPNPESKSKRNNKALKIVLPIVLGALGTLGFFFFAFIVFLSEL